MPDSNNDKFVLKLVPCDRCGNPFMVKDDQLKYLEAPELKSIFEKHSNYISYPIYLLVEKITTSLGCTMIV